MTTQQILHALATGPKATTQIAGRCRGGESGAEGYDLGPLHALWQAGTIAWDWGAQMWRLPGEIASGPPMATASPPKPTTRS